MAIDMKDTLTLMQAMERIKTPASFLLDTFFPNVPEPALSTKIAVEYRKKGRSLAPFVSRGAKGVNMKRAGSTINIYEPPMMGPRTIVDPAQLNQRGFGEDIVSSVSPAQRAAKMQAEDLAYLQSTIINRKNKMAADILTTGKCNIEGYADDGTTELLDTIEFDWDQKVTPSVHWDQAGASIYDDIKNLSETIQENSGMIPTVMVCGKNIEKYILGSDEIMKWLAIPNAQNLSIMNFAPQYTSPQVRYVGRIMGLNLDVYTYTETYTNDEGEATPFIGADDVVLGVPGRGRQLHGAVTLLNEEANGYVTYSGIYVPYYAGNKSTQELAMTMYSRCVLAPEFVDDWGVIKTKG